MISVLLFISHSHYHYDPPTVKVLKPHLINGQHMWTLQFLPWQWCQWPGTVPGKEWTLGPMGRIKCDEWVLSVWIFHGMISWWYLDISRPWASLASFMASFMNVFEYDLISKKYCNAYYVHFNMISFVFKSDFHVESSRLSLFLIMPSKDDHFARSIMEP